MDAVPHVMVEVPEHDHPAGDVIDTNDVDAGIVSDSVGDDAVLGPAFVTPIVYVMLPPTAAGSGLSLLLTERSAETTACVMTEVEMVVERPLMVVSKKASFVRPPAGADGSTCTTSVNAADVDGGMGDESLHVTVPPEPGGVVQDHPAGGKTETNVVDAGSGSRTAATSTSTPPLFDAVMV
jgi:hypothetical protein